MKEKLSGNTKIIILILGIMITIIGVTYSFVASLISGVETESTIAIGSGMIKITYTGSNAITGENIVPGWSSIKEFTVVGFNNTTVNNEDLMDYAIKLIVQQNTFTDGAIRFELTGTSTNDNDTLSPLTGKVPTGTGTTLVGTARFSQDDNIKNNVTHTYILTISFPDDENKNQNEDMNKSFKGYVIIEQGKLQLPLSNQIAKLNGTSEEVFQDDNNNIRFKSAATSNYIIFNNETWRILGLYESEDYDDEGDLLGTTSQKIKIIKSESIGTYAWDTEGSNSWENASLQIYLNNDYYNSLNTDKSMISVSKFEDQYKNNWIGKIAIISYDDFYPEGYKSTEYSTRGSIIKWINSSGWLLDAPGNYALYFANGYAYEAEPANFKTRTHDVHPTIYLKPNIMITSGNGSSESPFQIELQS